MMQKQISKLKCQPIVGGQEPGRNEKCPCGSDLKYKDCHGDDAKISMVQRFATAFMSQLIHDERMKHGLEPYPYTCNSCNKGFKKPVESTISPGMILCPICNGTDIVKNKSPKPETETKLIGGN